MMNTALRLANTGWPRGDVHETFQGGHPPEDDDYKDHSADGWGFLDTNGTFPTNLGSWFDQVAAQGTETPLPHVKGGWHDAADFDRRDSHFGAVSDLVHTFLMFPEVTNHIRLCCHHSWFTPVILCATAELRGWAATNPRVRKRNP